jgi:hypothetical protein
MTSRTKTYAKKECFAINFIHLIHKHVIFYPPLSVCVTASIFTDSAFIFLTLICLMMITL